MKSLLRLGFVLLMLGILGCVRPPSDSEACQENCKGIFELCRAECLDSCAQCVMGTDASTACRYEKYVHEQEVQGDILARELQSYRDPLQCRKVTCNCKMDFNICSQACTGEIRKQLRARPFCI